MEELAFQLFAEDRTSISYRQLGQPIRSFFEISDIDDVDYFSHDIRTCSFLHRTTNAGYVFIHRSFQEFFVAKKLLADVRRIDNIAWASRLLPPEIIRFASELLIDSDPIVINHLVKWVQQSPASVLGSNCVSVISISGKQIPLDVADAYGLAPDLLASAAAYQNGDENKGNLFVEFVYRTALKRVAEYVARSQIQEELDQGDIDFIYDAVHDEFFRLSPRFEVTHYQQLRMWIFSLHTQFDGLTSI
jgi:hypothetical protein